MYTSLSIAEIWYGSINKFTFVEVMAWGRTADKPSPKPVMDQIGVIGIFSGAFLLNVINLRFIYS